MRLPVTFGSKYAVINIELVRLSSREWPKVAHGTANSSLKKKHTSIYENSELNVFKKTEFVGKISGKLPNVLFGTNVSKTLESCW